MLIDDELGKYLPPRHLICQIAVLFVRTVFEPAWPLSMDGETVFRKYNENLTIITKENTLDINKTIINDKF